jgi:hypothetical protein
MVNIRETNPSNNGNAKSVRTISLLELVHLLILVPFAEKCDLKLINFVND